MINISMQMEMNMSEETFQTTRKHGRCSFTSVIVDGKLDIWTGPNEQKVKGARKQAIERAKMHRAQGKTAYAVEVKEILEKDVK